MARTQKIKIINILLASVDGKIATHDQESTEQRRVKQFTNKKDFEHLQKLTAQCDAVFMSAKSMFTEQGAFRVKHLRKDRSEPHWFLLTKTGYLDVSHAFWTQKNIQKSVFCFDETKTFSQKKSDCLQFNYHEGNITDFLHFLSKMKIKKIALLGGGGLNGYFWEQNLVSDLYLTLSPCVIAKKNAPQLISCDSALFTKLFLKSVRKSGNFLFLHYKVK